MKPNASLGLLILICAGAVIAGCGSPASNLPQSQVQSGTSHLVRIAGISSTITADDRVLFARHLQALEHGFTDVANSSTFNNKRKTESIAGQDFGGQSGFGLSTLPPSAVFSYGTFQPEYQTTQVALPKPDPTATFSNALFAPTTHLPGQCYEVGTSYENNGIVQPVSIYVYTFCGVNGNIWKKSLSANTWGPNGNSPFSIYLKTAQFCAPSCQNAAVYTVRIHADAQGNEMVGLLKGMKWSA